jgi:hypothetical protein
VTRVRLARHLFSFMQVARRALAGSSRALRAPGYATQRALSTVSDAPTNNLPDELPWFVDPAFETRPAPPHQQPVRTGDSHPPFPPEAASVSSLERLYGALSKSPLLEPATLLVCKPPNRPPGPALPEAMPRGRRKRGGTDLGEGVERLKGVPESGGMWNWIVLAQVKDGAEKRGGIESVVRLVRGTVRLGFSFPFALSAH